MTVDKVKTTKAYAVQDDESGVIVFATNSAEARRHGGNEIGCEWEGVQSCVRAHWADEFSAQGWVPAKAFIDAGWWQTCNHCGCQVSDDSTDGDDLPHDPVFEGRSLYCTPSCKEAEVAGIANRAALKQEVIDSVLKEWPEAEVLWANDHDKDRSATFKFPGAEGVAYWRMGEDTIRLSTQGDLPAWEAYRAMYQARKLSESPMKKTGD
jgi:hypothetical protein